MELGTELLKYTEVSKALPEQAGNINRINKALERAIESRIKKDRNKIDHEVLLLSSELITATNAFLDWSHKMWSKVIEDYSQLKDVAKLRATVEDQGQLIQMWMDQTDKQARELYESVRKG